MLKKQLGNTNLELSLIGFGTAPLGGIYGKIEDTVELVNRALKLGINYFDTSPYYGNSEEVLGNCFKELSEKYKVKRSSYLISSKVGRIDKSVFNYQPTWIATSLENTLHRLDTDYLDIFLLHDIEFGDLDEIMTVSVPYLIELKKEGKIKNIGFSTYRLETVRNASKYEIFRELDVLLIYGHNTLINNSLTTIRPLLANYNIGLIDASPLALGLLRDSPPPDWHPTNNEQRQLVNKVAKMTKTGSNGKISLSDLAVYHTLTNMLGSSLLIGMETVEQLEANMEVYQKVLTINTNETNEIDDLLEMVTDQLTELRAIDIS